MTTLTAPGLTVTWADNNVDDTPVEVVQTTTEITFEDDITSLSFSYAGDDSYGDPMYSANADVESVLIGGTDYSATNFYLTLNDVSWGDGNVTTILGFENLTYGTDSIHIVVLDGDPLPDLQSVADFNAFEGRVTAFNDPASTTFQLDQIPGATVEETETLDASQVLEGTTADDVLTGGNNADTLNGGEGNDSLEGGDGADIIIGGDDDDFLFGGATENDLRDNIYGGNGNDSIDGGYGNDELRGDADNDTITGGFGADTVIGGDGNDVLTGQAWGDLLFGGNGDDFINGGFGYDRVNGGDGADAFFHLGVAGHGSDWIQDYDAAEGDILQYGGTATLDQFQVNFTETENAGAAGTEEAFVIYRPTGQILWALVDGAAQSEINIMIGNDTYDLLG